MGISLQTLDHTAFDHGTILAQTPAPGLPIAPNAPFQEVLSAAAVSGAEMLIRGLRAGVHVPPQEDIGWKAAELQGRQLVHAPKVTKADGQVDWLVWTSEQFVRRIRVLGSVWTHAVSGKNGRKRVIFLDAEAVLPEGGETRQTGEGRLVCEYEGEGKETIQREVKVVVCEDGSCLVRICDASWVRVGKVKVDGKPEQFAAVGLKNFMR